MIRQSHFGLYSQNWFSIPVLLLVYSSAAFDIMVILDDTLFLDFTIGFCPEFPTISVAAPHISFASFPSPSLTDSSLDHLRARSFSLLQLHLLLRHFFPIPWLQTSHKCWGLSNWYSIPSLNSRLLYSTTPSVSPFVSKKHLNLIDLTFPLHPKICFFYNLSHLNKWQLHSSSSGHKLQSHLPPRHLSFSHTSHWSQ